VDGVYVGPKERGRRLGNQRVDRSQRRGGSVRRRSRPRWTRGEKVMLVLILALLLAEVALAVVLAREAGLTA
jgi:cell division protein FtsL